MQHIQTTDQQSGKKVKLRYQDVGSGQPIVFIHGWPLSSDMWDYQVDFFAREGFRCVSYDRRGFGFSSKDSLNYRYDFLADDLNAVLEELDLNDVVLVGFSMGGGEIARYIGKYGQERIAGAVFASSVTPFMLKTDNHNGVEWSVFQEMIDGIRKDKADFFATFGKQFYGVGTFSHPVSNEMLHWTKMLASRAGVYSSIESVVAFAKDDFRTDLTKVTVPSLVIHGGGDDIVPFQVGGQETDRILSNSKLLKYDGAPHGLFYTHKDQFNNDVLSFIRNNATGTGTYGTRQTTASPRTINVN